MTSLTPALILLVLANLRFEVASLKPTTANSYTRIGAEPGGERYQARGATLKLMIQTAFHIRADQVSGGPDWIARDRFDLDAKSEQPATPEEFRTMLKSLLIERFHLELRRETKDLPVYLLTAARSGANLTRHNPANGGDSQVELQTVAPLHIKLIGRAASMELLAYRLGFLLDRPIIDNTGIKESFDFTLTFTLEPPPSMHDGMLGHNGQPVDFSGPTVFAALKQQLGLRLDAAKAPVQAISIERAQKPEAN